MTFRPNYQRSVPGGGRTVDTGPPRTNTGLTGLGAVGGATGVGAGALRVIVEFLTQYDAEAVKQLEADIARIQGQESQYQQFLSQENATRAKEEKTLGDLTQLRQRSNVTFTKAQRKELLEIRDLERSRNADAKAQAARRKEELGALTGFSRAEINRLVNEDKIRQKIDERRAKYAGAVARAEQLTLGFQEQQLVAQRQLTFLQNLRANLGPKLGSLALGAAGGIFGGAIVGLGFAAAQTVIDAVGAGIEAIIDPGKEAREILDSVADSINDIAESEGITTLAAARQELERLGALASGLDAEILGDAAAWERVRDLIKEAADLLKLQTAELEKQRREEAIQLRFRELVAQQPTGIIRNATEADRAGVAARNQELLAQATREVDAAFRSASAGGANLASVEARLAATADIAAAAHDRLASSIDRASALRISGLEDQLSAASGPSARTQGIIDQIEAMSEAQARSNYQSQLGAIHEQRALVLLEQRIRFQGESVRMSELSARGQIVAINAQIAALQRMGQAERAALDALNDRIDAARQADSDQDKQDQKILDGYDKRIEALQKIGDEQQRYNRLLDNQYKLSQDIRRQEGESIEDFLSRRANETRQLLAERDALQREEQISGIRDERDQIAAQQELANERRENAIEAMELEARQLQAELERIDKARQAQIEALNQRREQLELEVRLEELAEQEKQLQAQETQRQRAKYLQQQLEESQKADEAELRNRQEAIEKMIEAEKRRAEEAKKWSDQAEVEKLRAMVLAARDQSDASAIIGEVVGARRAYEELSAYLEGLGLSQYEKNALLAPLYEVIQMANNKLQSIRLTQPRGTRPEALAKGGVFMLNNAMNNPFGANIRTGEEGQEIGVVLSNRVAQALKEIRPSGPMNFQVNRSDDRWRDMQTLKRTVREVIREELRS